MVRLCSLHYFTVLSYPFNEQIFINISATIVSTPELLEHYIDYLDAKTTAYEQYGSILPDPNEGSGDKSLKTGGVTCVIADSNKSVVKRTTKNASNSFLTLGHIRLTADESDSSTLQEHKILEE